MGSAGHSRRTSDKFVAVVKILASSSRVTSVTKSFSLLTVIAIASIPTWNGIGVRGGFSAAQDSTSVSLILREAVEISVSPFLQKRSKPAPEPIESMVRLPEKPSSSKRCFMRSASGKTVEEPAAIISPETALGAYIAIASSVGASVAAVVGSATVATGSVGAKVGSTAGASAAVALPHAASKKLIAMITNMDVRKNLVISISPYVFIRCHLIKQVLRTKEGLVNIWLMVP